MGMPTQGWLWRAEYSLTLGGSLQLIMTHAGLRGFVEASRSHVMQLRLEPRLAITARETKV